MSCVVAGSGPVVAPLASVSGRGRAVGQHPIDPVHVYPGPEPNGLTRPVSERDQPHIRSPFETAAPTSRLRRAGLRRTKPFSNRHFSPWTISVRTPGSARTDQVLGDLRTC